MHDDKMKQFFSRLGESANQPSKKKTKSKYSPHQGKREMERRLRKM